MAAAFQQQIFALDARFNAYRAPNNPNFKTLYIRRRSQLLRENAKFKDIETIKKYINIRSQLLQRKYGVQDNISLSSSSSRARSSSKASLATEDAPPLSPSHPTTKRKNEVSISENYAFSGVHHIFDHHREPVTVVKFAHNDLGKLCLCSSEGTLSVCSVRTTPCTVLAVLTHCRALPVNDCDWSASNELLVSCGSDATLVVWALGPGAGAGPGPAGEGARRLRCVPDPGRTPLHCCCFLPANNNLVIVGNARGMVQVLNVSTGIYPKGGSSMMGGKVTAIVCESSGRMFWAANDKGLIVSYRVEGAGGGGALSKLRRLATGGAVSSLSWSPYLARHPALLVNVAPGQLCLYRIVDRDGGLVLKKRFPTCHARHPVRSTFCPIMSFRRGVCVVTGGEDCCVYFLDIEGSSQQHLNKLQGHASPVLDVAFNYDESLLASSDLSGLVIIWRKG